MRAHLKTFIALNITALGMGFAKTRFSKGMLYAIMALAISACNSQSEIDSSFLNNLNPTPSPTASTTVAFSPSAETIHAIPTSITATFSQTINATTLIPSHVSMSCSGSGAYSVSSVSPSGNALSAVITLSQSLAPATGEVCTLQLSASVLDASGNALSGSTSVAYTLDTVAPTVSFSPTTGVVSAVPASITATFSKAMVASAVTNSANWSMGSCTGSGVFGVSSVTYNSGTHIAIVNLSQIIAPSDGEICTLTPNAVNLLDTSGNALTANTAALTVDSTHPLVSSFTPPTSTSHSIPTSVTVDFSKAMQASTVTPTANWSVSCSGNGVYLVSSVSYNSGTDAATVTLSQSIAPITGETCTLTPNASSIHDIDGLTLNGSPSVAYTLDTVAPTVIFTPATSTRNSIPSSFTALFSKSMDSASTSNTANWSVSCSGSGGYAVNTVSLTETTHPNDTATVILTQTTPASNGETCTLTASTSILDTSGNALSGSNTSAITLDTTDPQISSFSPASATLNSIPSSVSVTFSKSMHASTVQNTSNWSMICTVGGSYSVSSVSLSGMIATVNLTQNTVASNGAVCTLSASSSITDSVGNPLVAASVAYTVDNIAPTILSETPANSATGIATSAALKVVFSKSMNTSTITTANFTVVDSSSNPVAGAVAFSTTTVANDTVTFTPSSPLSYTTTYTATLSDAAQDTHGNSLASDASFSFSTIGPADASLNGDSINAGSILAFVFEEGSGNTLYDISPAANNGTTDATWAFDSGENKEIQQFNVPSEANQFISLTPNPAQWTGLSQISAYFRVNIYNFVPGDYMHFFEFSASLGGEYLFFRPYQGVSNPTFFSCCSNYISVTASNSTWSYEGSWHDFTVSYDNASGASIIYIDGVENASGTLASGLLNGVVGGFNIFDGDSSNFQVSASVVRFWNRALTSDEVSQLHSNPMTGVSAP